MPHDIDKEDVEIVDCPECGGTLKELESDPSMLECQSCGHMISGDEARAGDIGEED